MCRYSIATLMAAKHDYELQADGFTHLHLDHRHMGVGGDDSWSPSLHKVLSFCMLCKMTSCKVLLLLLLRLHELLSSNLCNCRSMLSCRESTPSLSCLHLCCPAKIAHPQKKPRTYGVNIASDTMDTCYSCAYAEGATGISMSFNAAECEKLIMIWQAVAVLICPHQGYLMS